MIADAKSRFSEITDEIDLDADLFVKAIKEAIEAERVKGTGVSTPKTTKKTTPAPVVVEPEDDDPPFDTDDFEDEESGMEVDFEAIRTEIKNKARAQKKTADVKAIMVAAGYKKIDEVEDLELLTKMLEVLE
jgi:hypothetical protein